MYWKPIAAALLPGLLLSGCAGGAARAGTGTAAERVTSWRKVATEADRKRLRDWHRAWDSALPRARTADGGAIAADPALFAPDEARSGPALPPGGYRCRVFKLGAAGTAMREFTAYPAFRCKISDEGGMASFQKLTGSQRPTGLLFPDDGTRMVFVGTLMLGDETAPLRYGADPQRDMIGYVDRIGERRWRLVLPWPSFESQLDVIELVPEEAGAAP
ncbi:DUF4893 domain-containing protein [Sphingomonas canadensis]|uniref:DUF4893 domain-containing protein n=1 Tax=Sphingomonas canadensis TaxID=1219257 RepID=A0ABW3H3U0_9SPHN|nr:DUF4893 domain-containing protein [Sphingomonas canadensis]MCW3835876.1 DUF4893 domain-containing protein [Sphingomonas canadensis]